MQWPNPVPGDYYPLNSLKSRVFRKFQGGAVCYHNDAKVQVLDVPESMIQQHGAVSEEAAIAMATEPAKSMAPITD